MKYDKSNELFYRSRKVIPLGSQTFSKSFYQFPVGASPLFIDRGSDAYVWDVDENKYIDYMLSLMPVVLGHGDNHVDQSIRDQLEKGIIFSLSSELEVQLAELLVDLIPSAEMVRFSKNGSDVTSAAVRLCRAYTGRDYIAVAGYHGWHDWYIATTSRDIGIPDDVKRMSLSFKFNDIESLEELFKKYPNSIAGVILEPAGVCDPDAGFLEDVRSITDQYGSVLIFDEIVTGFRIDIGGAQNKYGVLPDLSVFGKAMANGMPISAIVGKRRIMKLLEEVFFSGTFGGEILSIVAAITTINKLIDNDAPSVFHSLGQHISKNVSDIIDELYLQDVVNMAGTDWWPRINVEAYKGVSKTTNVSLLRQELIENGILMTGAFNLSLSHNRQEIIDKTISSLRLALTNFSEYLNDSNPQRFLRGEPVRPIFQVRG